MVNGQSHLNGGDLHIAHDAVAGDVELVLVVLGCPQEGIVVKRILFDTFQDGLVVLDRQLPCFVDGSGIHLLHLLLIGHMDLGLVLLVIAGADDGIEGDAKSQQEGDDGNGNGQNFSFRGDPPFKMGAKIMPRRVLRLSGAWSGLAYCCTGCFSFFLKAISMTTRAPAIRVMPMTPYIQVPWSPV